MGLLQVRVKNKCRRVGTCLSVGCLPAPQVYGSSCLGNRPHSLKLFSQEDEICQEMGFPNGGEKTKETIIKTNLFGWHTSVIQALGRMKSLRPSLAT